MSDFDGWTTFALGQDTIALPVVSVMEVLTRQPLTPIPRAPRHVFGLINLRGQVIPAVDLRTLLSYPPRPESDTYFLLIIGTGEQAFGVIVDEIGDVRHIDERDWQPIPPTLLSQRRPFVSGVLPVQQATILALRVEALMPQED